MINLLPYKNIAAQLIENIRLGLPFSLIRLGDGENSIFQYPKYCCELRMQYVLNRALEDRRYTDVEKKDIKKYLVDAIESANFIGIYPDSHENPLCRVYSEHLKDISLPQDAGYCYPGIHFYLQQSGVLRQLIREADAVTLVCGRDVAEQFEVFFEKKCEQILVPSERMYRIKSEVFSQPHYPKEFQEINAKIKAKGRRHLYLVGAGFLGKYYCKIAKDAGCMAIDIGSVFDYWANIPSREGYLTVVDGQLSLNGKSTRRGLGLTDSVVNEVVDQGPSGHIFSSRGGYVDFFSAERLWLIDKDLAKAAAVLWLDFIRIDNFRLIGENYNKIAGKNNGDNKSIALMARKNNCKDEWLNEFSELIDNAENIFFEDMRIFYESFSKLKENFIVFDLKLLSSVEGGNFAGFLKKSI